MTREQAESELMQIYGSLSPNKQQALDVLMAQADGEYISKQSIYTYIKSNCNPYGKPTLDFETGKKVLEFINNMPSVAIPNKTGHWITKIKSDLRGDMWSTNPKCSECGGEPYYSNTIYNYKFCPYCGARMIER